MSADGDHPHSKTGDLISKVKGLLPKVGGLVSWVSAHRAATLMTIVVGGLTLTSYFNMGPSEPTMEKGPERRHAEEPDKGPSSESLEPSKETVGRGFSNPPGLEGTPKPNPMPPPGKTQTDPGSLNKDGLDPPPPQPVIEGWVYAGWYGDNERWRDTELDFERNLTPRELDGRIVTSSRGSNVRVAPPDWQGSLTAKIGQVDVAKKLLVQGVRTWRREGWKGAYVWLRVQALGGSRAAQSN